MSHAGAFSLGKSLFEGLEENRSLSAQWRLVSTAEQLLFLGMMERRLWNFKSMCVEVLFANLVLMETPEFMTSEFWMRV
jgi:hypothetical protein